MYSKGQLYFSLMTNGIFRGEWGLLIYFVIRAHRWDRLSNRANEDQNLRMNVKIRQQVETTLEILGYLETVVSRLLGVPVQEPMANTF